jgi:hypothetical protein
MAIKKFKYLSSLRAQTSKGEKEEARKTASRSKTNRELRVAINSFSTRLQRLLVMK